MALRLWRRRPVKCPTPLTQPAVLPVKKRSTTPCCPIGCCCARTATNDSNDLIEARGRIDLSLDLAVLMESEIDAHGWDHRYFAIPDEARGRIYPNEDGFDSSFEKRKDAQVWLGGNHICSTRRVAWYLHWPPQTFLWAPKVLEWWKLLERDFTNKTARYKMTNNSPMRAHWARSNVLSRAIEGYRIYMRVCFHKMLD